MINVPSSMARCCEFESRLVDLGWVGRTLVDRFAHGRKKQREAVTLSKSSLVRFSTGVAPSFDQEPCTLQYRVRDGEKCVTAKR